MRYIGMFSVLTACAVSLTGCGQMGGSSSRGGMAVVDLDKVAAETGRQRILDQSLDMQKTSLNQTLAKIVEDAKIQRKDVIKDFGEEMTVAEKEKLANWERSASIQLTQIKNKADANLAEYRQSQIADFRLEVKPIAQEIASKRGLSIVIPKNEGLLLSVDPGVDITEDVIKVLREKRPVTASAAPPSPAPAQTSAAAPSQASAATEKKSSTSKKPVQVRKQTANRLDDEESTR